LFLCPTKQRPDYLRDTDQIVLRERFPQANTGSSKDHVSKGYDHFILAKHAQFAGKQSTVPEDGPAVIGLSKVVVDTGIIAIPVGYSLGELSG
jgi:hypothetical protein